MSITSHFLSAITHIKRIVKAITPEPTTIIHFRCDGCMAQDWKEIDRGVVIGRVSRVVYGSPSAHDFIIARRPDGSTFECFANYCMAGEAYMAARTDNPDESLVGKMVYLT